MSQYTHLMSHLISSHSSKPGALTVIHALYGRHKSRRAIGIVTQQTVLLPLMDPALPPHNMPGRSKRRIVTTGPQRQTQANATAQGRQQLSPPREYCEDMHIAGNAPWPLSRRNKAALLSSRIANS